MWHPKWSRFLALKFVGVNVSEMPTHYTAILLTCVLFGKQKNDKELSLKTAHND